MQGLNWQIHTKIWNLYNKRKMIWISPILWQTYLYIFDVKSRAKFVELAAKATPGLGSVANVSVWSTVNFINILRACFSYESAFILSPKPKCNYKKLRKTLLYAKAAHKTLMKLTPGIKSFRLRRLGKWPELLITRGKSRMKPVPFNEIQLNFPYSSSGLNFL